MAPVFQPADRQAAETKAEALRWEKNLMQTVRAQIGKRSKSAVRRSELLRRLEQLGLDGGRRSGCCFQQSQERGFIEHRDAEGLSVVEF
ncbi:MAG: hypothetical protein JWL59_2168 [Chthoniobacteraceae bacterium]|nr:hypothetical protein [Chthoniobacteraceae bacterium]